MNEKIKDKTRLALIAVAVASEWYLKRKGDIK